MLWKKKWAWLLLVACVALLCSCSIDTHLQEAVKVDDPFATENEAEFTGLVITYWALPHGESTLVRMPSGKTMLIDTGSAEDWPALAAHLSAAKLTRLDYLVLTNDQPEHAGGFPFLHQQIIIDSVIVPKLIAPSIRQFVPYDKIAKQRELEENQELILDTDITMDVLLPSEPLFLSPQNNSLVFALTHDQLRFLFVSGINEQAEERLLARHPEQLKSAVLKVGDQGSNQGTSQPFLSRVDPQVAIIQSNTERDMQKEGKTEVLERLGESWAETYMTGRDGSITILSNGKDYRVFKQKK
ncbi:MULTISPECIES: ComEC/Rec2 family competence protein [Brevibacillus]|jgi:Predicted hydrolase (metallo-beta-lactamase superfamily)|uniref:ComEC/Rec2 family competence protein n=1 Tax=Brevibacillus TaxID=55080 RepID=UPI000EBD7FEA|nr:MULTISPECIES: MBL fold metallo-hydrolase [Brevibacillus]MBU8712198.1 MBL fold metallo-hydrolase [Brevibacillus parabrevis]MDR5001280.1 MBL fold metallo-hydrolase [Brevibacillus parabrevis]RNB96253.1 MBL fold metallo-hydrolase [Brevibacillus parabrevis]UED71496.1 MBL fold metallo-hydrolase [Brevibacillus sp. HD3.3A]WDV97725.1 MBL fold metallo-hydrolase [Brevibacillus parabrevis]